MSAWAWALVAGWLSVSGLGLLGALLWRRSLRRVAPSDRPPFPPVLVLLPVRAADEAGVRTLRGCLAALSAQTYGGDWRLVLAFEDAADPGVAAAEREAPARSTVILAGPARRESQKVHNLRAALRERRPQDAILVTLDVDTRPSPSWLADLTRPIRAGRAEAASGYRWLLPRGLPARLVAMIDRGHGTIARPNRMNLAWGGSTALTARTADAIDLDAVWEGEVSDDLSLTEALARNGTPPWTALRALVPGPADFGWRETLEFARRQHMLLRVHAPRHWALLGVSLLLPAAGAAVAAADVAAGGLGGWAAFAAALALQQAKAGVRAGAGLALLPAEDAAAVRRDLPRDRLILPLADALHVVLFVVSAFGSRVAWRHRVYRRVSGAWVAEDRSSGRL